MKRCARCGEPRNDFPPRPIEQSRDGLGSWCRECRRAYNRDWERRHLGRKRNAYAQASTPEVLVARSTDARRRAFQRTMEKHGLRTDIANGDTAIETR